MNEKCKKRGEEQNILLADETFLFVGNSSEHSSIRHPFTGSSDWVSGEV